MAESTYDLAGSLDAISLPELVQFLNATRRTGMLELHSADGRDARCALIDGDLVGAQLGQLRDREALIALMHWRAGRFTLSAYDPPSIGVGQRVSVPALVMEVARLEDELERHSADAPAPHAKLTLRDSHTPPEDPLECGARQVFEAIAAHPQIRLNELEHQVPLAPIKIRLAVAWMISMGMLGSRVSQTLPALRLDSTTSQWYLQLLLAQPSGVRALAICAPDTTSDDITQWVTGLAEDLQASLSVSVAVDGPSIVRIRPKAGGLISITFLLFKKKHRFLFQTFARTTQLLLVPEQSAVRDIAEWETDVPSKVPLLRLGDATHRGALLDAFRAYAASPVPARQA